MSCCCGTRTATLPDGPLVVETSCAGAAGSGGRHCNDPGTDCPMTLPCTPKENP